MRLLAIETAAETCSVALFEDDRLLDHRHERVGRGHAERLIPMIAELPERGRAAALLVDCGPGSFTGVRVGLAAARAFGLAWRASVSGYSSMTLIAATAFASERAPDTLAVAVIGGHGEYFVQRFARQGVQPITPLTSLKPEDAARACAGDVIAGSGGAALRAAGATGELLAVETDARATSLLPAGLAALPPSPIYGRAPDARLPA
ncbi:tRNA (adenosine(37)-N6)-threonylcarbamoyltransferase complex dimerization subunit type 1 TsaB [Sphingomonas sp. ID1715]|uniref:tRNA (adenosine(37)-N6)-threonylcarbamoyltransferase complex dimerization subunit type 1 TsaB n=1 Tax=Sphingomonas sp. ID1715 TaxID=1656898 RepID=UPI001488D8B4|nr:tRNA (adenosine(37)-N6)-threonylcarbamoyltransferase complex dimerization subunit type 1 TsaB [Sphingomonas sp. ID1715]NNM77195.1 tRNA (adenosine(37)-N6)-threonylcarbamoyltransferase complex dimerization subunit type 1 TsaB [Sphingomonas sp. ID1715]